jgi:Zn-dependent protease
MTKYPAMLNVHVEGSFCIYLAIGLLVIPLPWLSAWIIAAAIHEAGHIAAVIFSGHRIEEIVIHCRGARIITDPLGKSEWYCALAGPLSGLMLLLCMHACPKISICALLQSCYNLLPIYPLDGGRAVKGILLCFLKEKTVRVVLRVIAGAVIAVLTVILHKWTCGKVYLILAFVMIAGIMKTLITNTPCKAREKWVQ